MGPRYAMALALLALASGARGDDGWNIIMDGAAEYSIEGHGTALFTGGTRCSMLIKAGRESRYIVVALDGLSSG
jgi:hypothetical protein